MLMIEIALGIAFGVALIPLARAITDKITWWLWCLRHPSRPWRVALWTFAIGAWLVWGAIDYWLHPAIRVSTFP